MTYITADEVRNTCGVPITVVTTSDINAIIPYVESEMARWLNTVFTPTVRLDILDGLSTTWVFTQKNPLLSVRKLETYDTTINISDLKWFKSSGKVELQPTAATSIFLLKSQAVRVQYIYGLVDYTSTLTNLTTDEVAGTMAILSVASTVGFVVNDWVEIYGMDGNREVAQIKNIGVLTITVDEIVQTHKSGSFIVKVAIPDYIKRYMMIEAGIAVLAKATGFRYDFQKSYTLGEESITKEGPLATFGKVFEQLLGEREMRKARIKPRLAMMVR